MGPDIFAGGRTVSRILTLLAAAPVAAVAALAADPPERKPLTPAEVASLIGQLRDEDFQTREAATEALKRRPEAALALLRADRTAESPEVKQRLASILPVMMSREAADKRLAKLRGYIRNRQIDRVVETMVACRQFVTLGHREQVLELARDLSAEATKLAGKEMATPEIHWQQRWFVVRLAGRSAYWPLPQVGVQLYRLKDDEDVVREPFLHHHKFHTQDGDDITINWLSDTTSLVRHGAGSARSRLVIAADRYDDSGSMGNGILMGNGELQCYNPYGPNLIITTGNVSGNTMKGCVVLCGGDFKLDAWLNTSVVFAGGDIRYLNNAGSRDNVCRERDKDLIGAWKLYSAAEAGADLGGVLGLVWVRNVRPQSAFAAAGVEPGEFVAAVNGVPVRSVRDAERLLCRAAVSWGGADLTLARGGRTRDVIVTLQEW